MATELYRVLTAQDYYLQMRNYSIAKGAKINNFNSGSRIRTMYEAISLSLAKDSANFFIALKRAIPVSIYSAFDFNLKDGFRSVGTFIFKVTTPAVSAINIPAGVRVTINNVTYETFDIGVINIGNTESAPIAARATTIGENANIAALAIDTQNNLGNIENPPSGVEFVYNPIPFIDGTSIESEEQRQDRFKTFIKGLARANLAGVITGMNSIEGIVSFDVKPAYPVPGVITIYAEDGIGTLSLPKRAEIEKVLLGDIEDIDNFPGYVAAGISIDIQQPLSQPTDFEFNIVVQADSSIAVNVSLQAPFLASLKSKLLAFINAHKIGKDFVPSKAITLLENADSAVYDVEIVEPIDTSRIIVPPGYAIRSGGTTGTDVILNLVVVNED